MLRLGSANPVYYSPYTLIPCQPLTTARSLGLASVGAVALTLMLNLVQPTTRSAKPKLSKPKDSLDWCPCRLGTIGLSDNKHWFQCTFCLQWWHFECLGLTQEEFALFQDTDSDNDAEEVDSKPYRCPCCQISVLAQNPNIICKVQSSITIKSLEETVTIQPIQPEINQCSMSKQQCS